MSYLRQQLVLVVLMFGTTLSSSVFSETMDIFTLSAVKISNTQMAKNDGWTVKEYAIDGPLVFEKKLSEGLSSNPEVAMEQAKKRIVSMNDKLGDIAIDSYKGKLKAVELGVKKLPAIVINKKIVIYGVTDAWQALKIYSSNNK